MIDPFRIWRTLRPIGARRVLLRSMRPARGWGRRLLLAMGRAPAPRPAVRFGEALGLSPGESSFTPPGRFRFLGRALDLGAPIGWNPPVDLLWRYHLHYLSALREDDVPVSARVDLLRSWVAANPPGRAPGWDPYPLSLRLANALEFVSRHGSPDDPTLLASLAKQAFWLEGTLERDLGANHLLENFLALAWCHRVIPGPASAASRKRDDERLADALATQFLSDGFHYERSPGYHAQIVEDLLRLLRLLDAAREEGSVLREALRSTLSRAVPALETVLHDDGDVALFNDAAIGQALPGRRLAERARGLLGDAAPGPSPVRLGEAGLHRLESGGVVGIVDFGEVGPDEQPGHAHADTGSFEWSCGGVRMVVDGGVHGYAESPHRAHQRGTAAHNTMQIDGTDSTEVWGAFRVGRRARPFDVRLPAVGEPDGVEGAHDGYAHLHGRPIHRRRITSLGRGRFRVEDRVEGRGRHLLVSRVRLHPKVEAVLSEGVLEGRRGSCRVAVVPIEGPSCTPGEGLYSERFGRAERCVVAEFRAEVELPVRWSYDLAFSATDRSSSR